jgi:hypothetical protein
MTKVHFIVAMTMDRLNMQVITAWKGYGRTSGATFRIRPRHCMKKFSKPALTEMLGFNGFT